MEKLTKKFVIASITEANEHLGLNATVQDELVLFEYRKNIVWKKMEWMPVIQVYKEKQEDSTHTINGYFVNIPNGMLPNIVEHFRNNGLDIVEL